MPLQLAAATVPGAAATAQACGEERQDRLRLRPTGTRHGRGGGAAAGGRRGHREAVACEECDGMGWMLCDFCKGKKNNVKSEGTRVYRRCPTCKAAGFILCPRCRVYKCITFPESNES
ncbi:protein PHOTOSYSTEM I ASSEMBLY 2, chloroplastic-like isoform X4 [Miscanthus floridulus]|uniref:protein PHOTOSYSTEM I ASSEMBLY 2, chloroplastic-like isoform X4 n=1 Tax=Miscanthus floridulus TaxID=154761 RepID=UPI0034590363